MKAFLVTIVLALTAPLPAAAAVWSLSADDWARPRSGLSVSTMSPLPEVVVQWSARPQQLLLIRYPGGEEGLLWAHELRSWLVALGIPLAVQELAPGSGGRDRIELELVMR
jgi:hypothetical protein